MERSKSEIISIKQVFEWIDVATYKPIEKTIEETIDSYISSPYFGINYISPDRTGGESLHGPFPVTSISSEDYKPCTIQDFIDELHKFCHSDEDPTEKLTTPEQDKEINELCEKLSKKAEKIFWLKRDEEFKDQDIGWILFIFEEFLFFGKDELVSVILGLD